MVDKKNQSFAKLIIWSCISVLALAALVFFAGKLFFEISDKWKESKSNVSKGTDEIPLPEPGEYILRVTGPSPQNSKWINFSYLPLETTVLLIRKKPFLQDEHVAFAGTGNNGVPVTAEPDRRKGNRLYFVWKNGGVVMGQFALNMLSPEKMYGWAWRTSLPYKHPITLTKK